MALIGYTRVSTAEQNLSLQRDALAKAGYEEIQFGYSATVQQVNGPHFGAVPILRAT